MGGLFKEYWEQLAAVAFSPDYHLFSVTENGLLYPNEAAPTSLLLPFS